MNPILQAAIEVERVVRAVRFPFCFIGGVAVQRWGQPRMTADIDLTVITGFGEEERHVDALLAGRDKDWGDIRGIVARQPHLDQRLIWDELLPLLELREDSETEPKLRRLLSAKP